MSSGDHSLRVHPPLGGYLFAVMVGLYALVTPVSAGMIALEGEPFRGLVLLVLGVPMFLWLVKEGVDLNRRVRDFRRRCRAEHGWLFSLGVVVRLAFVAFVAMAVLVDVAILKAPALPSLLAGGLLLLVGSMVSVFISAVTRAAMQL